MSASIAYLFPGQGSQFVGMGRDLFDRYDAVREGIFDKMDEICGKRLSALCFDGPLEELTLTENLQPAVTAVSLACLHALQEAGVAPQMTAGHSLGEYASLVAAGVIASEDALRLVDMRGRLMQREAVAHPGGMAAVIGLPIDRVEGLVAEVREGQVLAVANHNSAEQIVVTGEMDAVSRAVKGAQALGAKALPLNVSGAWHCSLMEGAVGEFRDFISAISFKKPVGKMFFNATGKVESEPEDMKDIMARQLTSPVRWYQIVRGMLEDGVDTFVEVGPKRVLTGLVRKIAGRDEKVRTFSVQDLSSLESFLEAL